MGHEEGQRKGRRTAKVEAIVEQCHVTGGNEQVAVLVELQVARLVRGGLFWCRVGERNMHSNVAARANAP